ncbi:MAG: DUF1836 domain-containing protein [Lachnospiraceae bacterium]|nr:DUF1836 domain-containing protein [Lachnospiraceae bacterium]
MKNKTNSEIFDIIRKLGSIDYIDPDEIPNIALYMDQITTFMDANLADSKRSEDDKILTKTMINNYTKNDLLPPPVKKKYSKEHIYLLIFIYYLKNMMTISDIQTIIKPLSDMFYGKDGDLSLEEIYLRIFQMEEKHSNYVTQDIMKRFKDSKNIFPEIKDEKQRDYLSQFAFMCMLSYDIYMKKSLIERMVDTTLQEFQKKDDVK